MKARLVLSVIFSVILITIIMWAMDVDFDAFAPFYLRYIGLLLAAVGLVFLFFQFVFVSRIKFIETGFGLDQMLRWHRLFGRLGLVSVFMHALLIIYYRLSVFGDTFFDLYILVGLLALVGFITTGALASQYRRIGLAYETWRNIHLVNYLLFPFVLIHVFYHTPPSSPLYYLWMLLGLLFPLLIIYRLVRIITIKRNPYEVVEVKQESEKIWSLYFKGKGLNYMPGQFLFVQLLRNGNLSSSHPFTISNSPTRRDLSITPKVLGDFTLSIKDTKVGDRAYIDAPYGVFSFLNYPRRELVFIAGGIGITPFISMLRYIYDQNLDQKVTLFWVNRSENNLCFTDELKKMEADLEGFRTVLVMSDQPGWVGEKGRLNGQYIRESLGSLEEKEFFICGPPAMSDDLNRELQELGVPHSKIHRELFEL